MRKSIFKNVQYPNGITELQCTACPSGIPRSKSSRPPMVLTAWRSPHASLRANQQLERDLKRSYVKYYIRTLIENAGLFWS